MKAKTYYRRNLPHYQPPGATYFVTFRLAGSLPQEVLARLKEERAKAERQLLETGRKDEERMNQLRKRHFARFDKLLDTARHGPRWLQNAEVAEVVSGAIRYRDGREYELLAYCIMPNHVHLVMTLERNGISLKVLQSLKRFTAREANKILARAGAFWQHESYDHVVRDDKELIRVIAYVLSNPEKAGLVGQWKLWRWSYTKMDV
jgi:putative transposase